MLDISCLSAMLGTWEGDGRGEYPTIEPFTFLDWIRFVRDGEKPVVYFEQRVFRDAAAKAADRRLHWESGTLIVLENSSIVRFVNSQSSQRIEILEGTAEVSDGALVLDFASTVIANDARMDQSGKTGRRFVFTGDRFDYLQRMATHRTPELHDHIHATLRRVS